MAKVKELIEELEKWDPEFEVEVSVDLSIGEDDIFDRCFGGWRGELNPSIFRDDETGIQTRSCVLLCDLSELSIEDKGKFAERIKKGSRS